MPRCPRYGSEALFAGPALRVVIDATQIRITRTGWRARWRGGVQTVARESIRDVRLLPWGGALLIITDSATHTLELGAQAEAALLELLAPPCTNSADCACCARLADESR